MSSAETHRYFCGEAWYGDSGIRIKYSDDTPSSMWQLSWDLYKYPIPSYVEYGLFSGSPKEAFNAINIIFQDCGIKIGIPGLHAITIPNIPEILKIFKEAIIHAENFQNNRIGRKREGWVEELVKQKLLKEISEEEFGGEALYRYFARKGDE